MTPRLVLPMVLLLAALELPGVVLADPEPGPASTGGTPAPIVQTAPYSPYWREAPVSTDPTPPTGAVLGITAVRGTAVHAQGNEIDVAMGDGVIQAVHMPPGPLTAEDVQYGWTVEAVGPLNADGSLQSLQVTIYPTD